MEGYQDRIGSSSSDTSIDTAASGGFGDDWVHEIIAMTRPGVEIRFPVRAINEREIPFVYDDFC